MQKYKKGDMCNVSLDPTFGREQQGFRPIFILSPEEFNTLTGTAIVAPITNGGAFARQNGFSVSLLGTGLQTTGVIRCDQIRTLDLVARQAKKIEHAPDFIIEEAMEIVLSIFED